MTASVAPDTDALLGRVEQGDASAVQELLVRHRSRLRRMVSVRMDPRLAKRVDPSDVVQEALFDASQRLPAFARERPIPFYPWLRQIAWDRLLDLQKRHLRTAKRNVRREEQVVLNDDSIDQLARQLVDTATDPQNRLMRDELRQRVKACVQRLEPADREILVLRHLEQMPVREIAALLKLSESAVKMRRLRAVEKLRCLLDSDREDSQQ